MASVKYEPVPKGYKRLFLVVASGTDSVLMTSISRKYAEESAEPFYGDRVIPIDVPLSALKPAKAKK